MKQEFHVKQKFCLVNSYRNTISKWALGFRYRNFFIPRVEKNLKISPWEENSNLPRAYGPWEDRVSSLGLIFGGFFNPWDEEISIPETRPIRKSYISRASPEKYCYDRVVQCSFNKICAQKSHSFSQSYSSRNILTRFVHKSHSFGHSYSSKNILTRYVQKNPSFGYSYSTRNILTRFVQKSPSFGYSYSSRHIKPQFWLQLQQQKYFTKKP